MTSLAKAKTSPGDSGIRGGLHSPKTSPVKIDPNGQGGLNAPLSRSRKRAEKNNYDFSTEAGMHQFVHDLLKLNAFAHVQYLHFPKGLRMPPRTAAMLKNMGATNGAADWLVIVRGKAHWLELKKGKSDRPSDDQNTFATNARRAGCEYVVASTPMEARTTLYLWAAINVLADTVADPIADGARI